jgi:hypothetical protein
MHTFLLHLLFFYAGLILCTIQILCIRFARKYWHLLNPKEQTHLFELSPKQKMIVKAGIFSPVLACLLIIFVGMISLPEKPFETLLPKLTHDFLLATYLLGLLLSYPALQWVKKHPKHSKTPLQT